MSKEKVRAQVKSRFYYYFWGIATVAVVAGQIYVGSGYRIMAKSTIQLQQFFAEIVGDRYGP
jgi:hypothetical protein